MIGSEPTFSASEFVAVFNQSIEMMYPTVTVVGELANFKISRNRWVYFDLKDEAASVRFFGTVLHLPGPLEDGLVLEVRGRPRLHPTFGFSINVDEIRVSGEGSIKKAQNLLAQKLLAEGLFDQARKRQLPYPPENIGIISSKESAALADFRKIIDQRWGRLGVQLLDTQVQGVDSPKQIVEAIQTFNQLSDPPEVLVLIRGGGSADDLAAYSTEPVVRAVAASRIPTLVAIGHETDESLAELAADQRASTPSNAAELLVPDAKTEGAFIKAQAQKLSYLGVQIQKFAYQELQADKDRLTELLHDVFADARRQLSSKQEILRLLDPKAPLSRGYALVRDSSGKSIRSYKQVKVGGQLNIELGDGIIDSEVRKVKSK